MMAVRFIFLFSLLRLHFAVQAVGQESLNENQRPLSPICRRLKCQAGYSAYCLPAQKESTRCIPCEQGTFSTHASRRKACRPCSRCDDNEFELSPCIRTSNVVCQQCSQCPPGIEVVQPCEKTRDTVCREWKNRSPVQLGDVVRTAYKEGEPQIGEAHSVFPKERKEHIIDKDKMTIIEAENPPWLNGTRKPKRAEKRPSRFSRKVQPTPPTTYYTSTNGSETKQAVSSGDTSSGSFEVVATTTLVAAGKTISTSSNPTVSTVFSPEVKSESDTNTKESTSGGMAHQGGKPNVRRHTRQHTHYNSTRKATSSPPRKRPPNLPRKGVITTTMSTVWGMSAVLVTENQATVNSVLKRLKTLSDKDDLTAGRPNPKDGSKSGSIPDMLLILVTVGLMALAATLIAFKLYVHRKKCPSSKDCFGCRHDFRQRRTLCPSSTDRCSPVTSVTTTGLSSEEWIVENVETPPCVTISETDNLPTFPVIPPTRYSNLQAQVTADVHHTSPAIGESSQNAGLYPQFITLAENTFTSSGGKLSHPDSNVAIIIDNGVVAEGVSQRIFFGVVYDETLLLRDIPETPERTLISPVIQCGPEDVSLLKPVKIIVPHCLYVNEVEKTSISVYRCGQFADQGPMNWKKVPLASERNCQSKAWFTVKKDTIHIKTKTFSFWSVFARGGPKKKRARMFASKPDPQGNLLHLRFYIYSDNDDSMKRVERKDRQVFPDSKKSKETPFRLYKDNKDIRVRLNPEDLKNDGWELDKKDFTQTYCYDLAYKNGFRAKVSCDFPVQPIPTRRLDSVKPFSCNLKFQQDDHAEQELYFHPGFPLLAKQSVLHFTDESSHNNNNNVTSETLTVIESVGQNNNASTAESSVQLPEEPTGRDDEPLTEEHCRCICAEIGVKWKPVLRNLPYIKEKHLENLDDDYRHCKVSEKCLQGLLEWRKIAGPQKATTKELCNALRRERCLEALEALSKEGVGNSSPPVPISEALVIGKSTPV